jgi:hypothetical protein
VNPLSTLTDADGHAQTQVTISTTAGSSQLRASVVGVASPAVFTVTAAPGPLVKVLATVHVATVPTALDTVRLSATGRDQYGNAIPNATVTWTSQDPATLTVDAGGLVHVVKRGGPVYIVASATSATPDSVSVSAPPSPCGSTPVTAANAGQVITDVAASGLCLRGGASSGEYALIPFYGTPNATQEAIIDITARGIGAPSLLASISAFDVTHMLLPGAVGTRLQNAERMNWPFEWRLREEQRKVLAPRISLARQQVGARGVLRSMAVPRANFSVSIGDYVNLNSNWNDACDNPTPAVGRVAAVSTKAIVVEDTTRPPGGFTDAEYASFATTFDTLVYPLDVQAFGEPTDIDGNGHVIIFFTPAVNRMTPPGSGGFVEGFTSERDLFPTSQCTGSNQGEMFYMIVPDPNGAVNGNPHSKQEVSDLAVDVIAHEFQHLINGARRMYINNATDFEETWLNEGLSEIAEELMFYRTSGLQPRQNLGTNLLQSQAQADAFNLYFSNDFSLYYFYLQNTSFGSPFEDADLSGTMRGAAWSLLRYSADRARTTDGDFWYQLVNSQTTGRTNITNVLGLTDDGFTQFTRDWAVSLFADDVVPGIDARFSQPSWNVRRMLATWFGQAFPFPITALPLTDGYQSTVGLVGGGSIPVRFTLPAYQDALITVTSSGVAPPAGVMLSLVRVR